MNPRNQNLISIGVVLVALVIGSSKWLPIGGTPERELQPSVEACCTSARAG
ncbi:hypothetical protein [Usitatibacter palustris]|uniref:Uncharacterized protein n=1 Tax=Usitatibacter palustris TaxID=2732487 RepID=A0A6M4H4K0_9PROT|nr:hypothetical protein [Usitatibacter palustris]QJR14551.1 hypothetical protein DSM104440_01352 [Usitatibacter palustris]